MKKYAIYRSENGYYYYLYCDTLEALAGTPFADIITEDRLPVVLDGKGGYRRFTDDEIGFTEIIESDEEVPLPLERMFFKNHPGFKLGWISPEGDTYSCDYTGHAKCAAMLAKRFVPRATLPDRALGRAGWIKVIDSWNGTERQHRQFVYSFTGRITNRQGDVLFDLGLYNNPEVKEMLNQSEDAW